MKVPRGRLLSSLFGGLGLVALALPASAEAHGIVGKADLPIPVWLFSWAAAIVLVVSFVALSTLWQKPQLQEQHRKRLFKLPQLLEWLASLIGVGLFALLLYSGLAGAQVPNANFSVTFIYVIFWVGMPLASVLFGDIFRAFSPWRTCARALGALGGVLSPERSRGPLLRYPKWLGVWPSVAVIVGFAWLELVYVPADREHPSTLAALSLGYFVVMVAGMASFGIEEWGGRADGFGVYFNLLSRLSALCRDGDGVVYLRRVLSGVTDLEIRPGTVALICTIIGTTTFDGFSNGGVWRNIEPSLGSFFSDIGFNQTPALELAYTTGLLLCIVLIRAVYGIGIAGVRSVSSRYDSRQLTDAFAHTLVPIGAAYRARPLLLAADLAVAGDRSTWPRTRWATARTSSARADMRSTITSSPTRPSGTCRWPHCSPATSPGSRSRTTARWSCIAIPKRRCAASTGCSR